jgi:hypothetical protein
MVANGTLGKYRKKNIGGGNNAYYALPESKAKGMEVEACNTTAT